MLHPFLHLFAFILYNTNAKVNNSAETCKYFPIKMYIKGVFLRKKRGLAEKIGRNVHDCDKEGGPDAGRDNKHIYIK